MSDNPANEPRKGVDDATRIPMGLPQMMLEVPEIEGYIMHWFADRPGRISRAVNAGYEFVHPDEVRINNFGLASSVLESGNTDLGTRVSVHGSVAENGGSERLYLMKIKKEWYEKDMELREQHSDRVVNTLRNGLTGAEKEKMADQHRRYARNTDNIFTKRKKALANA